MTFQLSLDEWMEGQQLLIHSRNHLKRYTQMLFPYFFCLVGFVFVKTPNFICGLMCVGVAGGGLYDRFWLPYRRKAKFRRDCQGELTPPITYEFSEQGFVWRSRISNIEIPWSDLKARIEGQNVWIFILKTKDKERSYGLIVPKRATESEEGRREWTIVDAAFAPPVGAPIAAPR